MKNKKQVHTGKLIKIKRSFKLSLVTKLSIILVVLSCLVYANSIRNGYVMDDVMVVSENRYVQKGLAGIPLLLTTHHLEGFGANNVSDYYRPLSLVMFAIEYRFFGLNPAEGHFFNIVFFAACVVLLFLFLNKLFNGEKVITAFTACLLFTVHPVHTEVVANIKSRDELLCFFFSFLSLILFISYAAKGKLYRLFTGSFCLFLAVLSKETAVTFLGVIPLVFFFYKNENKKRSLFITAGTVAVVVLFLCLWQYAQSRNPGQESLGAKLTHSLSSGSPEGVSTLAPKILVLGYQLKLLFVPYPLNANYSFSSYGYAGFGDWRVLVTCAAYFLLVFIGFGRLFKYKKDPWAFGILFYLVTLSLYSNIIPLGQPLANRYAFFPSAGFCFVFALAFERWILTSKASIATLKSVRSLVVLVPVLLCFSIMTIARNSDWRDNYTLNSADLPQSPGDYILQYKAGLALQVKYETEQDSAQKKQINDESIKHFLLSLEMNPDYTEAHSDIGVAYSRENNYDSAQFHFKRVLELNPSHFNASVNLATLLFKQQHFREAIFYYRKATGIDSTSGIAWYNMGICYARIHQLDSSVFCSKKVIEIAPEFDHYKSFGNAAILYKMMGNMDSAKKYEEIMKQYFPGFSL